MIEKKLVSVVIPAYNEAENIPIIASALEDTFATLPDYGLEIIFVADGCTDNSIAVIESLAQHSKHIFYLEFSRNFGHQLAVKAGMDYSRGDAVICMDGDMQHPPSLIPELIKKWQEGYEVVYTIRKEDKRLPFKKRFTSRIFYKVLNKLSSVQLEAGAADYRLLDRSVVDVMKQFHENEPFLRGLVKWVGYRQFAISYNPAERHSGQSKYSLKKMLRFALQGVTSFSTKPLYMVVYLGFLFSGLSVLYLPYVVYAFLSGHEVSGWASLIMTIVFFGGLQLIMLGIIGIYIGKMFTQVKVRPNYIVRSTNINTPNKP
ncbi:glycosyltransferase family 2 protein [Sphingobacterium yanglingense]|uniref:Dolichol-phosphate mannosyltransferase n=1 Tax=Sphingobacterium yanglingense TaxID=1437280 RepID=A0A4V3DDI8_9SPHI|nr:glycosyltransferase family 2 protein [Sphingobacterium yanglingense]TDQ76674.1 dolichol-phosphate mannosyltransferase [Sphingobacterium yanglingense]